VNSLEGLNARIAEAERAENGRWIGAGSGHRAVRTHGSVLTNHRQSRPTCKSLQGTLVVQMSVAAAIITGDIRMKMR
jgi:hypothetical protein